MIVFSSAAADRLRGHDETIGERLERELPVFAPRYSAKTLKAIRAKIRSEPVREPLNPAVRNA